MEVDRLNHELAIEQKLEQDERKCLIMTNECQEARLKKAEVSVPKPKLVNSGGADSSPKNRSMGRNNRCIIEDMDLTQSFQEDLVVCYEESRSEGDVRTVSILSNTSSLEIRKETQAKEIKQPGPSLSCGKREPFESPE